VQITFREQYQRLDGRGLRIREMADALAQAGWPRAPFVFAVQGAAHLWPSHVRLQPGAHRDQLRSGDALQL